MNIDEIVQKISELGIDFAPRLLAAILIAIIGFRLIKLLTKGFGKVLDKREIDPSLKPFMKSLVSVLLKIILVITVFGTLGIEMTSFIAILGAAGLAVGMALSGTLQNFAGGVMILIFKPFKVGDKIEADGYTGKVSQIQIFNTILKTGDNKTIIIPNGSLSNSSLTNYTTEEKRRVDIRFGIGYGDDVDKAKLVLKNICDADDRILQEPKVFLAVAELADSSVNIEVRAWVKTDDYWDVLFDLNEKVYKTFPKENLNIPYPNMDVHVYQEK